MVDRGPCSEPSVTTPKRRQYWSVCSSLMSASTAPTTWRSRSRFTISVWDTTCLVMTKSAQSAFFGLLVYLRPGDILTLLKPALHMIAYVLRDKKKLERVLELFSKSFPFLCSYLLNVSLTNFTFVG